MASPLQVIDAIITKIGDPRPDGNTLIENILSSFKLAMIGFFLALIVGLPLGPVSYTHLDVYKRQLEITISASENMSRSSFLIYSNWQYPLI